MDQSILGDMLNDAAFKLVSFILVMGVAFLITQIVLRMLKFPAFLANILAVGAMAFACIYSFPIIFNP